MLTKCVKIKSLMLPKQTTGEWGGGRSKGVTNSWRSQQKMTLLETKRTPRASLWLRGKASACSVGDLGLIPGSGRSPGEGKGYPLQHSGLENSMDRGTCQAPVHGVVKSRTRPSELHATPAQPGRRTGVVIQL